MSLPAAQLSPYLTKKQVAHLLQVCVRQVDNMKKAKQIPLPFYPSKRAPRWRREELEAYLEAKATAAITLGSN
jgi:predicted DNA-binding transcriptional regulator AlpA